MRKLVLLFALLVPATALAQSALPAPDGAQAWFDAHSIAIVFLFGLVWKYLPQLKAWTNELIPWLAFLGYVLTALVGAQGGSSAGVQVAQLATGAVAHQSLWATIGHGIANVAGAVVTFESFARPLFKIIGVSKP